MSKKGLFIMVSVLLMVVLLMASIAGAEAEADRDSSEVRLLKEESLDSKRPELSEEFVASQDITPEYFETLSITPSLLASFDLGTWFYGGVEPIGAVLPSTMHAHAWVDVTGDGNNNIVASFDNGTWYLDDDGFWRVITRSSAKSLLGAPDGWLYASFASGTWLYDAWEEEWFTYSTSTAHALTWAYMIDDGYFDLVASFDGGTWYVDQGENIWVQLTHSTARALEGYYSWFEDKPYLHASFSSGTWVYDIVENDWYNYTSWTAHAMTMANMYEGDFDPVLVASFDDGTWYLVWEDHGEGWWSWEWAKLSPGTARVLQGLF